MDDNNATDRRNRISGLTLPLKGCAMGIYGINVFGRQTPRGMRATPSGTVIDRVTFAIVDNQPVADNLRVK
jgi:hypothetical protein